jgi:hypothetical protein
VQLEESLKKINAFEDYASKAKARTIKNKVTHLNQMLFLIIFKNFHIKGKLNLKHRKKYYKYRGK